MKHITKSIEYKLDHTLNIDYQFEFMYLHTERLDSAILLYRKSSSGDFCLFQPTSKTCIDLKIMKNTR